jgi:prophage lambdaCh01, terminase, small subunit
MLKDKEKSFANEYIINKGNAYKAALAAGYSQNTAKQAYQWLTETKTNQDEKSRRLPYKAELVAYIKEKLDEIESAKTMSAKEVVEMLSSIARGEVQDSTVVVESVGDGCSEARLVETPASLKDRLVAIKELAKIHGVESSTMNINLEPVVLVNDLTE